MAERSVTQRGLAVYDTIPTVDGDTVELQQSSLATEPQVWLRSIDGPRSADAIRVLGPPTTTFIALSADDARRLIEALQTWIDEEVGDRG